MRELNWLRSSSLRLYAEAFYELNRLIGIAVTLPVTSVKAERSFSCLKLMIKTHLRTTMLDDRLSDIAVLFVHSQRANMLDLESGFSG